MTAGAAATTAVRVGGLVAAIVAAAAVSVALARGTDGYLESLKKTHPWLARFGQSVLGALNPLYAMLKGLGLIGPETDKVADAQKQAVPAVKDFSDAVAEEAESLQQLRRALAEVELATKSRLAAAQRAYGEERTTLAQFTAERIRALEKERAAKLAQIDEDLRLKRQEAAARGGGAEGIGPHGGVDKEGKKLLDDIKQLELERKKVVQETTDSIADLQSEARNKERENEERHRDSLLSVMRTGAERQIEVLRDAAEQNESLRLDSERKIVEIERRQTDAEIAEVRRRIEAAAAGTEARTQLEDELAQKLAERGRQRAEQARRIAKAELDAALLPLRREGLKEGSRGAGDEGAIARIRDAAERRAISVAASEQQVANVIDAGFARRIKALKDEIAVREKHKQDVTALNAQLIELEQERTNASEEGERRVRDGREKDLENAREHADRLIPIERALASARLAVREAVLNATRATFGREAALRKERYAVARERARIEHDEAVADLNEREHAELLHTRKTLAKDEDFNKRRLEIQKLYDALRKAEDAKTAADIEGIDRDERRERDPFTRLKDLWTDFKDHVRNASDSIRESVAQMADTIRDAFGTLEGGIRQGIVAWLLYGESLGKALKRALAESLAAVAADAAIQALKHGAYAIGSLAFGDARGAILHAKAAAAFALLAVGAGAGARIAANSAGLTRNSSSSTAASAVGQDDGPRNKEFTYGVGSTPASADAGRGVQGHGLVGSALAPVLNRIDAHIEEQRKVNAMQQAFTARVTSHIESLGVTSEAQIVTIGAPDAHEAVGVAMVKESGRNAELNDTLARNFRVF